jgi:hypothetical protein
MYHQEPELTETSAEVLLAGTIDGKPAAIPGLNQN